MRACTDRSTSEGVSVILLHLFCINRRNRVLFAEVTQSVTTTSWKQNEIVQKGIEKSSFVLISKSSVKGINISIISNVQTFSDRNRHFFFILKQKGIIRQD